MKILLLLGVILGQVFAFSQSKSFSFNIQWDKDVKRCVPCDFDPVSKNVYAVKNIYTGLKGDFNFTYTINNMSYVEVDLPSYTNKSYFQTDTDVQVKFGKSSVENYLLLRVNPFMNQNGQIKMIDKIDVTVNYEAKPINQYKVATFAPESVLKNGTWYKFGVDKSGVYKLDKTALESIGINTSTLNPQQINIYGNHIPELPESNSAYHPDDLQKNAIFIQGESDGVFNASDFILFYATGPIVETWDTGNGFKLKQNNNDSLTYYYLQIGGGAAPKRVQSISNSNASVTNTVTTSNGAVLHELETDNLISSGDNWLGEVFDIELAHTVNFNLPNISISSPVNIETAVAVKMKNGTGSFDVLVNNSVIDNLTASSNTSAYDMGVNHVSTSSFNASSSNVSVQIKLNRSAASTIGWLNKVTLNYRRNLSASSNQFLLRDWNSVGTSNISKFNITNANSSTLIWEVTDPRNVKGISGALSGSSLSFTQATDTLRSFVVFNSTQTYTPIFIGEIENQNLHALAQVDYLIVTHADFKTQADRLADLHRNRGLSVNVVEIQKVYNEFSSGLADPVAIRWFAKMFYDRAITQGTPPQSLLLFGDGSFDALNRFDNNSAFIPSYRSKDKTYNNSTISFISSYTSDDFFGILDDSEAMAASDLIDLGVGRISCATLEEATAVVNKIQHYMNFGSTLFPSVTGVSENGGYNSTFGDWRNKNVLIADDENYAQFVQDCEGLSDSIELNHNELNTIKLYFDAYQQIITSGGQRYPEVEAALNQSIEQGALTFNYVGHGGETGLSLERVVSIPMIEAWTNVHNLPLFITATCEFTRFDDPERRSAGEIMFLLPNGGAVTMLTTTRLVYISTNSTLLKNLYSILFDEVNGEPLSMGEIIRQTKNLTAGDVNMRNFTLIGDPALQLGKPNPNIVTDSINGVEITGAIDTLKALTLITINGHIEDYQGNELTNYKGIAYPTVFDKVKIKSTLAQDPESPKMNFDVQNNIIYKGKVTVANGKFKFSFVVPKDIDYAYGKSKISYYAENGIDDKVGVDTSIVIGGINPNGIVDEIGPEISLYMNDENFANGGLTDTKPLFLAKVADENGFNTSGNGIGHDITLILDGNTANPYTLNNYYESDLDTYKSGQVKFQFIDLEEGQHQLMFKIWDVNNNSSEATLEFVVVKKEEITIKHLLNFPNPFTTRTEFYFEHNQVFNNLETKVEIYTVSGKLVKTIYQNVNTFAFRSEGIEWDGRDEYGDKLARGVYVYRLSIKTPDGEKANKIEKLVIL